MANVVLTIDGSVYEYEVGDFIKLCEGELPAQENVLRHILRLQKIAADNVAAEMRALRERVKELESKRGRSRKAQ